MSSPGVVPLSFDETGALTAPSSFGGFRVLHQIGSGVLGPVFRAYDPQNDRLIAVKAFRLDLPPQDVARLADAFRRLAGTSMNQPAIVGLVDAGLEGTTAYLAMEFVAAETLDVALRHLAPAPLERALPILTRIADALEAGWAAGLGHGALHPRDVLVAPDTNEVRVTGVGVAPALESVGLKVPVRRPYTAPERAEGKGWDIRADVYSLGAIAHELLTGRRPAGHGEQDGALATSTPPEQRVWIRRILAAALAEHPQHRFATPRALITALESAARGEAVTALPEPPVPAAPTEPAKGEAAAPEAATAALLTVPLDKGPGKTVMPPRQKPDPAPAPVPAPVVVGPEEPTAIKPPAPRSEPRVNVGERVKPARTDTPAPRAAETAHPAVKPPMFVPPPPPPSFPWMAVLAALVAGFAVGGVIFYQVGVSRTRAAIAAAAPATPKAGDTEVTVPSAPPPVAVAPAPATKPDESPNQPEAPKPAATTPRPEPPKPEPAPTAGRLLVRSVPSGATVMVDGHPHGQTPATVRDLSFGTHTVVVSTAGYASKTEKVTVTAGEPARNLTFDLEPTRSATTVSPVGKPGLGSIYVDSKPRGATVILDGKVLGTTPLSAPELLPGPHALRFELLGRKPAVRTVVIKAGEQSRVEVTLDLALPIFQRPSTLARDAPSKVEGRR